MIDVEKSASARLPMMRVWLERGERFAASVSRGLLRVDAWLARRLSAFEGAQARRAARRELYALDDRLLNDIGLRREQIPEFVDGMFRGNSETVRRPSAILAKAAAAAEVDAGTARPYRSAA